VTAGENQWSSKSWVTGPDHGNGKNENGLFAMIGLGSE
jgi:hypothetical protein